MNQTTLSAMDIQKSQVIALGRQLETNYRQIIFDFSDFDEEITSITLVHQRSQDVAPYIVATVSASPLVWTVTDVDTSYYGFGKGELRVNFASGMAKTIVFSTLVIKSITADAVIPSALQSWYDAMIDYIDDHAASPEQIEAAVEAYLEDHPIPAPVQSVNGYTGAVVLTAADVGALASNTAFVASFNGATGAVTYTPPVSSVNGQTGAVTLSIPTKTSDLQNDSGYLSSAVTTFNGQAGAVTYTAPVSSVDGKTGAVSVLPTGGTTGQFLAKKTGTNYDVEWQTVSGGGAVDSVNGQTGTVVLGAADVGALPDTYTAPVTSVNTRTGAVTVDEIFWCTWGTTTSAQIEAAIAAGLLPCVVYNDMTYTLRYRNSTTNHRFVCNYGGKEFNVVCQSGAWLPAGTLTFLTTSYTAPVTSVNGQTGAVTVTDTDTTYTLSIASNAITLTPSTGTAQTITPADATTTVAGYMSATDKSHLDTVYADYSSAITALGVE